MAEEAEDGNAMKGDDHGSVSKICSYGHRIPARVVLGILSFFAFFTNYMLRVNLSIAIVAMVKEDNRSDAIIPALGNFSSEAEALGSDDEVCFQISQLETNDSNSVSSAVLNSTKISEEVEQFEWNSVQQGILLGAFYWTYVMSAVPGAILARHLGTKFVYGAANGISAIFTLLTPFAARTSFKLLIIVRLIEGFVSGTTWPAMHTLASRWIPPHERSTFVTSYMGNAVGTAFTYPICGLLIDHYGWPSAFYVPGCLTLVWCFFWWLLVFDSPSSHPRIKKEERKYIEDAVSLSLNKTQMPVPWLEIAKSVPFWALSLANFSVLWAFMIVIQYAPTYLKTVHGFNIRANGALSGLPNIMRFVFAMIISYITDRCIQSRMYSFTVIRKVTTSLAAFFPGLLFLLMTNVGCDTTAEVLILTIAAALGGATSSGPLANTMDLAPNYSGIIMSLVNMISMSNGFIVPSIVGAILNNNYSKERWRVVFMTTTAVSVTGSLVYMFLGSGEIQPWNQGPKQREKKIDETKYRPILKSADQNISIELTSLNEKNDCNKLINS